MQLNSLKKIWFQFIQLTLTGVGKSIAGVHAPWTQKGITYADIMSKMPRFLPGDVILTRTEGELTTVAIPGFWKHVAVFLGDGKIIEAVSPCVREAWVYDLLMRTDNVAILRWKEISTEHTTMSLNPDEAVKQNALRREKRNKYVNFIKQYIGRPYNFGMDIMRDDQLFCSEIPFRGINYVMSGNNKITGNEYLGLWERAGYPTFTPADFYGARGKFDLLYEKRGDKQLYP